MHKTTTTLLVVFDLVLLTFFGIIVWQNHNVLVGGGSGQQASIAQTLSLPNQASTSSSPTASSSAASSGTSTSSATHAASTVSSISSPAVGRPAAIAPAAGWTSYGEDQYAVAGTYPQAWYEYDAVGLGGSLQFTSVPQSQATAGGMIVNGVAEISIYRTLETVAQAQSEDSLNGTQEAATTAIVAGETVSIIAHAVASNQNTLTAYVPHGGYVYRIVLAYHGESQFSSIYSSFLATFRFTN